MFGPARKIPFGCPFCGHTQLEPPQLQSTYCRACGEHFEVARGEADEPAHDFLATLLRPRLPGHREIQCGVCGGIHRISRHIDTTCCPYCCELIDLRDVIIPTHVSDTIDTQGRITILRGGHLNSTRTRCGSAVIEGLISGALTSTGTIEFRTSGRLLCAIDAPVVVFAKGSDITMPLPIDADEVHVHGRVHATIRCRGLLRITKRGLVEGSISARSVIVDKGGSCLGQVTISARGNNRQKKADEPTQTGLLPEQLPMAFA